jgi:general secretion pathway protein G
MVVVLSIMSVILGGSVVVMRGIMSSVREDKARSDFTTIQSLVMKYQISTGRYPTTEQGLRALVDKHAQAPVPRRWTRVMDEVPRDPWGSEYGYRYPGARNPEDFEILSAGRDGIVGTEDDLSSQDP